jgi:hypothetical protein
VLKEDCWTINVAEGQVRGVYRGVDVRLQKVDHIFEIFLDSVLKGSVSQRSPIKAIKAAKTMIESGLR